MPQNRKKISFIISLGVVLFGSLLSVCFVYRYDKLHGRHFGVLGYDPSDPIYCKYADHVVTKYAVAMKKKYGLDVYGSGGSFLNEVREISITFASDRKVKIKGARELVVACTEELLKRINEDKDIRPYLSHYPFTTAGVYVSVCFFDEKGKDVQSPFISDVGVSMHGIVHYDVEKGRYRSEEILREPYQEALRKVHGIANK